MTLRPNVFDGADGDWLLGFDRSQLAHSSINERMDLFDTKSCLCICPLVENKSSLVAGEILTDEKIANKSNATRVSKGYEIGITASDLRLHDCASVTHNVYKLPPSQAVCQVSLIGKGLLTLFVRS